MHTISEEMIQRHLTGSLGGELVVYDTIDSTNNAAKLLAKNGAPHGSVVLARRQTAGKGRLGRSFFSPNEGIYMTVILRPNFSPLSARLVTPAAAVAVARAIRQECGMEVQIKWVNDVYYRGKKLCGILTESALDTQGQMAYLVVGMGINVSVNSFPAELSDIATSLELECAQTIDSNRLIAGVLNHLEEIYSQLESRMFLAEYRERSCVLGKQVQMIQGEQVQQVTAVSIDEDAQLVVQTAQGDYVTVATGEVSLKGDWR